MFWSQPIVGHKRLDARTSGDVPDQVSEGLRRTPVEPSTVQMKDCLARARTLGPAPPASYASHGVGSKSYSNGSYDATHNRVERSSGVRALQAPLLRFNNGAHCRHRRFVFLADRMPYPFRLTVLLGRRWHLFPPAGITMPAFAMTISTRPSTFSHHLVETVEIIRFQ